MDDDKIISLAEELKLLHIQKREIEKRAEEASAASRESQKAIWSIYEDIRKKRDELEAEISGERVAQ